MARINKLHLQQVFHTLCSLKSLKRLLYWASPLSAQNDPEYTSGLANANRSEVVELLTDKGIVEEPRFGRGNIY